MWVKKSGNGLLARTQFNKDPMSHQLYEMYRDGALRGWSVHVLPNPEKTSRPTREELRANPTWEDLEFVCRGSELAEYSAVAVPGNAETLTVLAERGIWY